MDHRQSRDASAEAQRNRPSSPKASLFHRYETALACCIGFALAVVVPALLVGSLDRQRGAATRALATSRAELNNRERDLKTLREELNAQELASNRLLTEKENEIAGLHELLHTLYGHHNAANWTGPRRIVRVEYHTRRNGVTGPYRDVGTLIEYQRQNLLPVIQWSRTHPENQRCPFIRAGQTPDEDQFQFTLHIELADGTRCPTTALRE